MVILFFLLGVCLCPSHCGPSYRRPRVTSTRHYSYKQPWPRPTVHAPSLARSGVQPSSTLTPCRELIATVCNSHRPRLQSMCQSPSKMTRWTRDSAIQTTSSTLPLTVWTHSRQLTRSQKLPSWQTCWTRILTVPTPLPLPCSRLCSATRHSPITMLATKGSNGSGVVTQLTPRVPATRARVPSGR